MSHDRPIAVQDEHGDVEVTVDMERGAFLEHAGADVRHQDAVYLPLLADGDSGNHLQSAGLRVEHQFAKNEALSRKNTLDKRIPMGIRGRIARLIAADLGTVCI
nr:hypothetical protein [Microvirga zambiensis]